MFVIFPQAIALLPFGQSIFAVLFFGMITLLALSSIIAMLETFTENVKDFTRMPFAQITGIACLAGLVVSSLYAWSN